MYGTAFPLGRANDLILVCRSSLPEGRQYTQRDSNSQPTPCKGATLPLSYKCIASYLVSSLRFLNFSLLKTLIKEI